MAPTAEESKFYFLNIHGNRWPVVIITEDLLTKEDKNRRPLDAFYIPVLAVSTNDNVHWVTKGDLKFADISDLIDEADKAAELGNHDLLLACNYVLQFFTTEHWTNQLRDLRYAQSLQEQMETAMPPYQSTAETMPRRRRRSFSSDSQAARRMEEEKYRTSMAQNQVPAEPSSIKRQRSPCSDPDDLYSQSSAAKKTRKDGKASRASSSASSITLKDDSQSLTSESSFSSSHDLTLNEKRPIRVQTIANKSTNSNQVKNSYKEHEREINEPVMTLIASIHNSSPPKRPWRPLHTLAESTRFHRQSGNRDDPKIKAAKDTARAREKLVPEHPGLGLQSEQGYSSGVWTTAQDAEFIRLKERTKPAPTWRQTREALHKKVAKGGMFKPMREFLPRSHYERTIKGGAGTGTGKILVNGFRARKAAFRPFNKERPTSKSKQQDDESDDSNSDEEAEEVPEDWLTEHDPLVNTSLTPWTTSEDAELIFMRERMNPKPSWQDTVDALNQKFHWRATNTDPRNLNNTRQRWRSMEGGKNFSKIGLAFREKALALLDDSESTLMKSIHTPFTTAEDIELVKLRDQELSDITWAELTEIYNARLHTRPGFKNRHDHLLYSRYELIRSKWEKTAKTQSISILEFVRNGGMGILNKSWTSAQDDVLICLKQAMPGKSWREFAKVFNSHSEEKGWPVRNSDTIQERFNKKLRAAEDGQQVSYSTSTQPGNESSSRYWAPLENKELLRLRKVMPHQSWTEVAGVYNRWLITREWSKRSIDSIQKRHERLMAEANSSKPSNVIVLDDDEPVPQAPVVNKLFTADEDGDLIVLREKLAGKARWQQITSDFNEKYPQSSRSLISLRSRYNQSLQEDTLRQIEGSINQRKRAIAALNRRGIEIQVNDSISDSSSERDEDDEEEEEKEEGVNDGTEEDCQMENDELEDDGTRVAIVIGDSATRFTVPLSRINTNRYFMDDEYQEPGGGHVIRGHRWNDIKAADFQPVHEFLLRSEFNPLLEPTGRSLQGITTDDQHNTQLLRCAQIFVLSRQLLLWDLAALVIRKFKLLKKGPVHLLMAAMMVFAEPTFSREEDVVMRRLLVEEVKKRFWDLAENHPTNMQGVMEKSPLFQVALFERMAENGKEKYDKMF